MQGATLHVGLEQKKRERAIPDVCLTAQTWASCHRLGLGDRAMRRSETLAEAKTWARGYHLGEFVLISFHARGRTMFGCPPCIDVRPSVNHQKRYPRRVSNGTDVGILPSNGLGDRAMRRSETLAKAQIWARGHHLGAFALVAFQARGLDHVRMTTIASTSVQALAQRNAL